MINWQGRSGNRMAGYGDRLAGREWRSKSRAGLLVTWLGDCGDQPVEQLWRSNEHGKYGDQLAVRLGSFGRPPGPRLGALFTSSRGPSMVPDDMASKYSRGWAELRLSMCTAVQRKTTHHLSGAIA